MINKLIKLVTDWNQLRCMNPSTQELLRDLQKLIDQETPTYTRDIPSAPGYYWVSLDHMKKTPQLIHIWGYNSWKPGDKLFTNWDGGCSVTDEIFENARWCGPFELPQPPKE